MFERFTDRARRVVVLAQEEARMLRHDYIGTEHILMGLIDEGHGVAAQALAHLAISLDDVRLEVQAFVGEGQAAASGHIPFTPQAKRVLERALREALELRDDHVGTEHILLGLTYDGEGVAAQVLVKLGADKGRIRTAVVALLRDVPEPQPTSAVDARIERSARAAARAIGDLPASQRLDALGRVQRTVLRGLVAAEVEAALVPKDVGDAPPD